MTGRYTDYDNVADFTVFKMKQLIHDMRKLHRTDIIHVLEEALTNYESYKIDIHFVNGWPHITYEADETEESEEETWTSDTIYVKLRSIEITASYAVEILHSGNSDTYPRG